MVNIETVAIATGAFILFLLALGWLMNRGNTSSTTTTSSGPRINETIKRRGGGSPSDGDDHQDIYIDLTIQDRSGDGLDKMEVTFEGSSRGPIDLASQDSESRNIYLDRITGGGTLTAGNTYHYQIEAQDNDGGDTTRSDSFSIGPTSSPAPQLNVHVVGTPQVGKDRSDIQLNIQSQAQAGKNLDEIKVGLTDSNGNNWTHGPLTIGSPNFTDTIDLDTICGANQTINNPKAFNYDVRVTDSGSEMQDAHGTININDNSGGGGAGGSGDTNINIQQVLQALLGGNVTPGPNGNLIINNNSQQQQQQQQMMGPGGAGGIYGGVSPHLYTMMMQQMQQMQMNQQQMMQQMMQFMQQNNYNQVNNQVIAQFMQQQMNIDIDPGDFSDGGDQDIEIEINQIVQQININQIENYIVEAVNDINISIDSQSEIYIENYFIGIIELVKNNKYEIEGDKIVINIRNSSVNFNYIEVKLDVFLTYLQILATIKKWELRKMIIAWLELDFDQGSNCTWLYQQLIVIYRETGETDDTPTFTGDNWEILKKVIRNSNMNSSAREMLLRILEGNHERQLGNETVLLIALYNNIQAIPKESIEDASQEIVNYMLEQNARRVDKTDLRAMIKILRRNWTLDKKFLRPHADEELGPDPAEEIHDEMADLISNLQRDEKTVKKKLEIDEEIIEELKNALNIVSQPEMHKFIAAINQMNFEKYKQMVQNGKIPQANQMLMEAAPDPETQEMITNPEWVHEMHQELHQAHVDIHKAKEQLEQEIEWEQKEVQQESDMDDLMQTIDGKYLNQLEGSLSKIENNLGADNKSGQRR